MSRCWIIAAVIAIVMAESSWALPAYADGGEELLERLLDNPAAQTDQYNKKSTTTAQTSVAPKTGSAAAVRTTPRDAIRLTPDRTEIVRLEQDAASVVVTNPAHAQVMLETPRLMLVMPRSPGSTSLFVLDKEGNTIFERDIIISGTAKPYVRIRKSCGSNDNNCNSDSYFYCPDGCYEVGTVPPSDNAQQTPPASAPMTIDTTPVPSDVAPARQGDVEPEGLPIMENATGLDTDSELDVPSQPDEEENAQ